MSDDAPVTVQIDVDAGLVRKAARAGRLGISPLLILCLFLPWALVSCGERPLGTQTGAQMLTGDGTPADEADSDGDSSADETTAGGDERDPEPDYAVWAYVVGLGLLVLAALPTWRSRPRSGLKAQAGATAIMLGALASVPVFGFRIERQLDEAMRKMEEEGAPVASFAELAKAQGSELFAVEWGTGYVASFVLVGVLALLTALEYLVLPSAGATPPSGRPPTGGVPPGEAGEPGEGG